MVNYFGILCSKQSFKPPLHPLTQENYPFLIVSYAMLISALITILYMYILCMLGTFSYQYVIDKRAHKNCQLLTNLHQTDIFYYYYNHNQQNKFQFKITSHSNSDTGLTQSFSILELRQIIIFRP